MVEIGRNVGVEVRGTTLVITVDLQKDFGPSGSGKSMMVASTGGNIPVPGYSEEIKIGLNVYRPTSRRW
jgi:hypothetical protein